MTHIVNVTASHIRAGVKMSPTHCPVALAIRETLQLAENDKLLVDFNAYVFTGTDQIEYRLPLIAREAILFFDREEKVGPFTFVMEPMAASVLV